MSRVEKSEEGDVYRIIEDDGSRSVLIQAPTAKATSKAPPPKGEVFWSQMSHHCPLCDGVFKWEPFKKHLEGCMKVHGKDAG